LTDVSEVRTASIIRAVVLEAEVLTASIIRTMMMEAVRLRNVGLLQRDYTLLYSKNTIFSLMMEAIRTSETSVNFNVTTRLYIPEDSKLKKKKLYRQLMK
jgi:hypothetical protein